MREIIDTIIFPGIPFLVVFFLMFYMPIVKQKNEKKKRDELLNALKKGDKVRTIGGIGGVIEEVKSEEVILKTDEHSDARIHFLKTAIATIDEPEATKA